MSKAAGDEDKIRLARALVSSEKAIREETVKVIETYISGLDSGSFSELKMLKLWKALGSTALNHQFNRNSQRRHLTSYASFPSSHLFFLFFSGRC